MTGGGGPDGHPTGLSVRFPRSSRLEDLSELGPFSPKCFEVPIPPGLSPRRNGTAGSRDNPMMMAMLVQFLIAAFAGLAVWAAASDIRRLLIPNRVVAAIAALWPAYAFASVTGGAPLAAALYALAIGVAAFAIGVGLFAARLFGGGDVKLLAAVALWAGPLHVTDFVMATVASGGALALAFLAVRTARLMGAAVLPGTAQPTLAQAFRGALKTQVPFGVAIAAGALVVASRLAFAPAHP